MKTLIWKYIFFIQNTFRKCHLSIGPDTWSVVLERCTFVIALNKIPCSSWPLSNKYNIPHTCVDVYVTRHRQPRKWYAWTIAEKTIIAGIKSESTLFRFILVLFQSNNRFYHNFACAVFSWLSVPCNKQHIICIVERATQWQLQSRFRSHIYWLMVEYNSTTPYKCRQRNIDS